MVFVVLMYTPWIPAGGKVVAPPLSFLLGPNPLPIVDLPNILAL